MTKDRARKKTIRARAAAAGEPYSVAARNLGAAFDPAAAREVVACARATLAEASVRIEHRHDWDVSLAEPNKSPGPLRRLAGRAVSALRERVIPGVEFGHLAGTGFLEPATGRYMIDYGAYAVIGSDGTYAGGMPGRSVETIRVGRTPEPAGDALWMLRHLPGITEARPDGAEEVRGTMCRRFTVRADPAPDTAVTVWIDAEHLRRVRCAEIHTASRRGQGPITVTRERTLELWDFGVGVDKLDWSRLPSFSSPDQPGRPETSAAP